MSRLYRGSHPVWPSLGNKRLKQFLLAAPIVLSVYLLATGDSGIYQIRHQTQQIGTLEEEIASLKIENMRLQEDAELLTEDLTEIERIARERYGMVKKNEWVYMVYPSSPNKDITP
jgi:cell division protein FtsB